MIKRINGKKNWRIFLLIGVFFCFLLVPAYQSKAAPAEDHETEAHGKENHETEIHGKGIHETEIYGSTA